VGALTAGRPEQPTEGRFIATAPDGVDDAALAHAGVEQLRELRPAVGYGQLDIVVRSSRHARGAARCLRAAAANVLSSARSHIAIASRLPGRSTRQAFVRAAGGGAWGPEHANARHHGVHRGVVEVELLGGHHREPDLRDRFVIDTSTID
jgi:hypothetical protein